MKGEVGPMYRVCLLDGRIVSCLADQLTCAKATRPTEAQILAHYTRAGRRR